MKTTINLPDDLFAALKARAAARGVTVTSLLERAVRRSLDEDSEQPRPFKLRDGSVKGEGLSPEFASGDWADIRAAIYEGHGG